MSLNQYRRPPWRFSSESVVLHPQLGSILQRRGSQIRRCARLGFEADDMYLRRFL